MFAARWLGYTVGETLGVRGSLEAGLCTSGFFTILLLLPLWLLAEPSAGRFGGSRIAEWALASCIVLAPVVVVVSLYGLSLSRDGAGWIVSAILLLPPAAAEELTFRGVLQDIASPRGHPVVGILVSSALFCYGHSGNPAVSFFGLLNIGLFGILLGLMRLRSGGLVLPTMFHWLWNAISGCVLGANVSGLELPSLLEPTSARFSSGFGPEEWPMTTLLLLVSSVFLLLRRRADSRERRSGLSRGVPMSPIALSS